MKVVLKAKAKEAGVALPDDFYLKDISFLSSLIPKEGPHLRAEKKFFDNNPKFGNVTNWQPIMGVPFSANTLHSTIRKFTVNTKVWDAIDQLIPRVDALKALLDNND